MKYYVYFDAYGHARRAVSEKELAENYQNKPDRFLKAMSRQEQDWISIISAATWAR